MIDGLCGLGLAYATERREVEKVAIDNFDFLKNFIIFYGLKKTKKIAGKCEIR